MENASRALMIAAGILIAIVIISVLVSTFTKINNFQLSKLSEEERQQIIEFNEQYTKYANQYVYGTEVISVINNALSHKNYDITVNIKFPNSKVYEFKKSAIEIINDTIPANTYSIQNRVSINNTHIERFLTGKTDFNRMAFKCTKVEYDNSTGKVNSISFEEKQWED